MVRLAALLLLAALPAAAAPWGEWEIRESQIEHYCNCSAPTAPAYAADPRRLSLAVAADGAAVLDGERLRPLHRFTVRPGWRGAPRFSPDGRYGWFASADGWIAKFDFFRLRTVLEIRVGQEAGPWALSSDARYLLAAPRRPALLVLLDTAEMLPLKVISLDRPAESVTDDGPAGRFRVGAGQALAYADGAVDRFLPVTAGAGEPAGPVADGRLTALAARLDARTVVPAPAGRLLASRADEMVVYRADDLTEIGRVPLPGLIGVWPVTGGAP